MSVFYKFKAWKDVATISFDGTGISVWDLKKEIIQANNLYPIAKEFDLHLYNSQTNEEYKNDSTVINRGTTITAQRLPARRSGLGTAVRYVTHESHAAITAASAALPGQYQGHRGQQMSKRFDGREEAPQKPLNALQDTPTSALADVDNDEAARIDAMFEQSGQQWEHAQQQMANARKIYNGPRPSGGTSANRSTQQNANRKPPHAGYVCYRCGQPGHWIQDCPTLEDQSYDNIRIRRTTGIPKSFLQSVEGPTDDNKKNLMLGSDGGFVIARPDAASWAQHKKAVPKNLSADDVQGLQPEDPDLTCPIDTKLLKDAVKTPCCQTSFCKECISNYLETHDFVCSECESRVRSLEQLKPDEDRRRRVAEYVEEMVRSSKEGQEAGEIDEKVQSAGTVEEKAASTAPSVDGRDSPPLTIENIGPEVNRKSSPLQSGPSSPEADRLEVPSNQRSNSRSQSPAPPMQPMPPQMQMAPMMMMQMQQLMMMLANPGLPSHMRMQTQMQLNQLQMMTAMMAQQAGPPSYAQTGPRRNSQRQPQPHNNQRQSPFYPERSSSVGKRDREEEGEIRDSDSDKRSRLDS